MEMPHQRFQRSRQPSMMEQSQSLEQLMLPGTRSAGGDVYWSCHEPEIVVSCPPCASLCAWVFSINGCVDGRFVVQHMETARRSKDQWKLERAEVTDWLLTQRCSCEQVQIDAETLEAVDCITCENYLSAHDPGTAGGRSVQRFRVWSRG